ncbi:acylphosphatase [Novymonas esmeraldas]|uniref:acylphosphatase n=1 Tax=Novymonas esmeraldas TaxID=1808958 RepID=A0AAW0EM73_9TRYP
MPTAKSSSPAAPSPATTAAAITAESAPRIVTRRILVSGRVQGVFYRKYTALQAAELGVTGTVRNLPDGRVEVFAEGTEAQVAALVLWCHRGSPKAQVTDVAVEDCTPTTTPPVCRRQLGFVVLR